MLAGKAVSLDSTSNITLGVCCLFDMVTRLEQLSEEEVRSVILYCMLGMFFFFCSRDSSSDSRSLRGRSGESSKCDEVVFRLHIPPSWDKGQ